MAPGPDFAKQAQDAINMKFAKGGDVSPAEAGLMACNLISHASRGSADAQAGVAAVCRGTMQAMLLNSKDLPQTAMAILDALPNVSLLTRVDPEKIMTWVLQGIAETMPAAGSVTQHSIQEKIEEQFMGVGAVFSSLCDDVRKKAQLQD